MKALKKSKKTNIRESGYRGSSKGTEKVSTEEKVILEWGSKQKSEYLKEDQSEDEEIDWIDSEDDDEKKDTDAGKTEEVKDDAKRAKPPPTSSRLSVSLGFGDQFLKLSSDTYLVSTVKDTTDAEINSLLDIKIQSEVLHIQSPPILTVPVSVISKPAVPIPVPVTPSVAIATSFLTPLSVSTIPLVRHQTTTPILTPLIITDAPTITATISEFDALSTIQLRVGKLEKTMHENKSFNRNLANHRLYHALMEALIEDENAMDNGVTDIIKDHKGKHDDDDPLARLNQGKKTKSKSAPAKEPIKEIIAKVVMDDDAGEDVVRDDDQP
nr:hypothetical protein [Tanacetum cinerariifolium]